MKLTLTVSFGNWFLTNVNINISEWNTYGVFSELADIEGKGQVYGCFATICDNEYIIHNRFHMIVHVNHWKPVTINGEGTWVRSLYVSIDYRSHLTHNKACDQYSR